MLNARQLTCIRLMIEGNMTQRQIAEELKVSEQTVCTWKKNKDFANEFNIHMRESIDYSASKAYREMLSLLSSRSDLVRFQAAKDILDRGGYKPIEKKELSGSLGVNIVDDLIDEDE